MGTENDLEVLYMDLIVRFAGVCGKVGLGPTAPSLRELTNARGEVGKCDGTCRMMGFCDDEQTEPSEHR